MELADLKPGNEVYLTRSGRIASIERITPSGRFIVDGNTYNPDGWLHRSEWGRIVPATDQHREKIEKRQIVAYLDNMNWQQMHIGQLRQIQGFIHGTVIDEETT